ncbi:MAG: hypothetical protein FJ095_19435 [Deltaproteobacteria bacterium]|nr:hypothetical protein [Deltaproteobacteria bacterium]
MRHRVAALASGALALLSTNQSDAYQNRLEIHGMIEVGKIVVTADPSRAGGAQLALARGFVFDGTSRCTDDGYRSHSVADVEFSKPLPAVERRRFPFNQSFAKIYHPPLDPNGERTADTANQARQACLDGDGSANLRMVIPARCLQIKTRLGLVPPKVYWEVRSLQTLLECRGFPQPSQPKVPLLLMVRPDNSFHSYSNREARTAGSAVPRKVIGDLFKSPQQGTLPVRACEDGRSPPARIATTKVDALPRNWRCPEELGHIPQTALPGTVPLYRLRHLQQGTYLLTTDANFVGRAAAEGYGDQQLEGYVFKRD